MSSISPTAAPPTTVGPVALESARVEPGRPFVMHVTTGLEIGGGEVLLLNLVEAAQVRGLRSIVVSLIADGPMRRRFEAVGVEVLDLGLRRGAPTPAGLWRLVGLIRRYKPDVVQGWLYHGLIAATTALLLSGRRRQTRLVHGIYGSSIDFRAYGLKVLLGFRLAGFMARFADAAIYTTDNGEAWHRQHGYRYRRVVTIENGIVVDRFRLPADQRAAMRARLGIGADEVVAISIARVDPMKGWDRLLAVTARIPGLRLLALGHGTENFPPHPSRILMGAREDVPALLAAADLFVIASLFGEGTSVALTEAMAASLPVVVTDVGDNARLAEGSGRVVAADDEAGLEQALRDLAADPAERARLGAAGLAKVRAHYSIEQAVAAYYAVYAGDAR